MLEDNYIHTSAYVVYEYYTYKEENRNNALNDKLHELFILHQTCKS